MKTICLLAIENCVSSTIYGPFDIFCQANEVYQETKGGSHNFLPLFNLEIVSKSSKPLTASGNTVITPSKSIKDIGHVDLILVPAIGNNVEQRIAENQWVITWLKEQHEKGCEIGSMCTGSFLLAASGLLDNKSATTHWALENVFKEKFPLVRLKIEKVLTEEAGLYTSGGASLFSFLIFYFLEKYCSRSFAITVSKLMMMDFDSISQNQFTIFSGLKNHGDEAILKAQAFLENNYDKNISIRQTSEQVLLETKTFIRRFKKATGVKPIEYLRKVKLESAKRKLESSSDSITEVMESCGYDEPVYFRKIFKQYTGLSPQGYRKKYSMIGEFI